LTLTEIEKLLQANRRSLSDFPSMPFPQHYVTANLGNRLIYDELNYDTKQQKEEFQDLYKKLTGSNSFVLPIIFAYKFQNASNYPYAS
jgi:ATP-dependent DNA helicase PIF1